MTDRPGAHRPRHIFRILRWLTLGLILLGAALGSWVAWGSWPDPSQRALPWEPDVILVLGGGNDERPREALRLAERFPELPVVVTGDGGTIVEAMLEGGLDPARLHHETRATSTMENAHFTDPILDELGAGRVLLVTNWFHVPRSLAIFRREQDGRDFAVSFEPRPETLSEWHLYCTRRERMAALHHIVRHRLWSF